MSLETYTRCKESGVRALGPPTTTLLTTSAFCPPLRWQPELPLWRAMLHTRKDFSSLTALISLRRASSVSALLPAGSLQLWNFSTDAMEPRNTHGHLKLGSASEQKRSDLSWVPTRGFLRCFLLRFPPSLANTLQFPCPRKLVIFPFGTVYTDKCIILPLFGKDKDAQDGREDYYLFHCSDVRYSLFLKEWPQSFQGINFCLLFPVGLPKKRDWRLRKKILRKGSLALIATYGFVCIFW